MLSDIFGEDKREKYLIILNLLKDDDIVGILYGKKGIGKKFIVTKAVRNVAGKEDIVVFMEASDGWYSQLLSRIGIPVESDLTREEFLLRFIDFLERFDGRLFVIFNNSQRFTEKQLAEVIQLLGFKEKVSVFVIGDDSLKEKLNPFKIGRVEAAVNFIFEVRPPEYSEFLRYFNEKYGGKLQEKVVKKLYQLSGGSIKNAEDIIIKTGKFPVTLEDLGEKRDFPVVPFVVLVVVILTGGIYYLFLYGKENVPEIPTRTEPPPPQPEIVDKKLPEEGNIEHLLPVKPRKKKDLNLQFLVDEVSEGITEALEGIDFDIPPLKHYTPPRRYAVQVASFKNEKNALRLKERLSTKFMGVDLIKRKNGITTVVIYAADKKLAEEISDKLRKEGFKPLVKKVRNDG
ncbi:MAG: hypothetical protein GXO05_06745 [Aquificae bacterium]|nr:hypothetical protein [Aquificota bacterium]